MASPTSVPRTTVEFSDKLFAPNHHSHGNYPSLVSAGRWKEEMTCDHDSTSACVQVNLLKPTKTVCGPSFTKVSDVRPKEDFTLEEIAKHV